MIKFSGVSRVFFYYYLFVNIFGQQAMIYIYANGHVS